MRIVWAWRGAGLGPVLLLAVALAMTLTLGAGPAPAGAAEPERQALIDQVNQFRREHGLAPLEPDDRLMAAAQGHTEDMLAESYLAHKSPDGTDPADRAEAEGYQWRVIAENVAAGQETAAAVVEGWAGSEGHRANMLMDDVEEIGTGYAHAAGAEGAPYHSYWTLLVGATR